MAAERDTNTGPLSRIPPEFNRSEALLITGLAQPSLPTRVLVPHSLQRCWQRSDPKEKKEPAALEAPGKLPCLGSGEERQGEEALQAQPCSSPVRRQRFLGL